MNPWDDSEYEVLERRANDVIIPKFHIKYRVQGREEEFESGPYDTWDEARYHFDDIATFDGVWDVRLIQG